MPYESFPQDLQTAKALKAELFAAIQKAKETGQTQQAEQLAQQTQAHLDQMEQKLWPFQEQLPQAELQKQYTEQKAIFAQNNLLELLPNNELGIIGIDHKAYPFPTLEQIQQELKSNPEFKKKMEQGFTELHITPFAVPLQKLTETVSQAIKRHYVSMPDPKDKTKTIPDPQKTKLFTAKKDPADPNEQLVPLGLDENQPLWVWDKYQEADTNGTLVYFPQQFTQENHQGQTKAEVLKNQIKFPGYLITLQEKQVNIPAENQGETTQQRKQLEANLTPNDYLAKFKEDQYQQESGLTPEEWLTKFLIHLEKTNEVIDDYQGHGKACYNLGGYFPASGYVSNANWRRGYPQALLDGNVATYQYSGDGARSGVRV